MPAKRKNDLVEGRYFAWTLIRRNGTYYADGRSNAPPQGRHSLEVRDRVAAVARVHDLDLERAVAAGRAPAPAAAPAAADRVALEAGRDLYLAFVGRPAGRGSRRRGGTPPSSRSSSPSPGGAAWRRGPT